MMVQAQAEAYQRDREAHEQATMMKLQGLAALSGPLWEVRLIPRNPRANGPISVVVPARNSLMASQAALANNPGYTVGGVTQHNY